MLCPLDTNNYCARHQRVHGPGELFWAVDPSALGQAHRTRWDAAMGLAPKLARRPMPVLECRHRSELPIREVECKSCNQTKAKVYACAVHGECSIDRLVADPTGRLPCLSCCRLCEERDAGPAQTVALAMTAAGLGDAIQGLLVAAAVKRDRPTVKVVYRCGAKGLPYARLFTGWDALESLDVTTPPGIDLNSNYHVELATRGDRPRILRYCDNAGALRGPAPTRLRDPEKVRAAGTDWRGAVVLCPFSHGKDREYSVPGWMTVERLLIEAGYRTAVVHHQSGDAWLLRSPVVFGDAVRVSGVLLNAACVIGVDSGPAHLAAALGAPTVVLGGPTRADKVFHGYPRVIPLRGALACDGCYWGGPNYAPNCMPRCPSLQSITPDRIVAAVNNVVKPDLIHAHG